MGAITDLALLQPVFDWLKAFLQKRHDLHFERVIHRPPLWYFYDADGDFVVKVEEELMDRLYFALNRDSFTEGVPEPLDQIMWSAGWNEVDRNWADDDTDEVWEENQ